MPNEFAQEDVSKIWSAMGLNPQAFPIYYPMEARPFRDGNQNSGAAGAIARLSRSLSNFPHMVMGVRLSNVYQLPEQPTADDVRLFRALKEWVDDEQEVRVQLAQQSIVSEFTLQNQLVGGRDIHWHPFPVPFPLAGANDISIEVRRVTGYPQLGGEDILPECYCTIVAAVLRADLQSIAPHRRQP